MKKIIVNVLILVFMGLTGWCLYPKAMPHPMGGMFTAYYKGFGLPGASGLLGKHWGRVEMLVDDGTKFVFQFKKEGYNPFKGYYPDGTISEEGECLVELMGFHNQPYPDSSSVRTSKCYLPDGTLASKVENGTGIQTYWTPNGVQLWELVLKENVQEKLTRWYPNGQLIQTQEYVDGKRHGSANAYYQNGDIRFVGSYNFGKRNGRWEHYQEDGKLEYFEIYEDGVLVSGCTKPNPKELHFVLPTGVTYTTEDDVEFHAFHWGTNNTAAVFMMYPHPAGLNH